MSFCFFSRALENVGDTKGEEREEQSADWSFAALSDLGSLIQTSIFFPYGSLPLGMCMMDIDTKSYR
jgi:hypothetical protein